MVPRLLLFPFSPTEPEVGPQIVETYRIADGAIREAAQIEDLNRNLQTAIQELDLNTESMKNMVQATLNMEQKITEECTYVNLSSYAETYCIFRCVAD